MTRYAYAAWDRTQDSTAFSPEAILEALTNDLLQHGDLNRALSELQQRGYTSSDSTPALPGFAELLQDEERQPQLQQLQQLEATLQQAGLMRRTADGLRLTPKGARQIGAVALRTIFHLIQRGWRGNHTATRLGRPGALTGETMAYEFGDAFDVHLGRTLANALLRQPWVPIRLQPQDFAVHCREPLTQSATVIMLDMSLSMELFDRQRFTAAKKVALALADEAPLVQFVKRLTEVSQGRAFYTTPERLGHYVIEDYMRRR